VREAVRRAEEAGIPDAEYRIKQFVLEVIDILARAGERYRRQALEGISTVEKALRATAFAGLSAAALYSVYSGIYSEAVVSSVASAVALVEVGQFREAVQYVQRAAKALYEAARDVFEHVKVTVQRLVELFVEAVARVLAWVDEHKAYLFLMAAMAAGAVALSVALDMWGLVELEKLAYAASAAPFVAGLADVGDKTAERSRVVAERWKVDDKEEKMIENIIKEIMNALLRGETSQSSRRPYGALLKLAESANLPKPLAELRKALARVEGEAEKDAAVVAALVLYKTLINNAGAFREWAELYKWARSLVERQEFTVTTEDVKSLRGAHRRLEEAAEEVRRELNAVLALYASHSRDLYEKLRPHLEVDVEKAEGLAEAVYRRLSDYSDANMGTKAYAALLSVARGGIYGHAATLFMAEGALADVLLLTPEGAHSKANRVAKKRGESVDPSRSPKGAVDWEERAASTLLRFLIGYGEAELKFRRVEKGDRKGFQVFRIYGGVKAFVGELWMGKTATYFKVSKEELRRFVEEARRTAPDLSGLDKSRQYLEWRATDVTTVGRQIVGTTAHSWQLRWYFSLLGEEKTFRGKANITREGIKLAVTARWPREREDQILRESKWLESLLGQRVENRRQLVDAINWSWVVEKVEKLVGELKPWIGPKRMSDAEREDLMRRMLGELALLAYFAEAKRGMDDGRWREERIKRLTEAVEALSGGKMAGEHAERLAQAIIYYAEGYKKYAEGLIESLAKAVGVSTEEMRGVVKRVLSGEDPYAYCLARDCARDEVVRKFVAPALELIMLEKARNNEFDREEALLNFGEMYATALAGDGSVGPGYVTLAVGGELGGGAALLRLTTLHLLNQLLPRELKFGVRTYMGKGACSIVATGEDAARFMHLLAVSAPSAGGEYLSPKFNEFLEEARVEVRLGNVRRTKGRVAADLTISEGDVAVKYNVYLRKDDILLLFASTDRSRVELAARLLRLAGVAAEVKKEGGRDVWHIEATTDMLAAGREELRSAIAEAVKKAVEKGWVDASKAERWLKKLEEGRVLKEGWPKYKVRLTRSGSLEVIYRSTNPDSVEREAKRFRNMGLEEGRHFTVKMPEEGREGYVSILKEGLAYAAWLSARGKDEQRLAEDFVKYILRRAEEAGNDVYEKVKKIIEEGVLGGSPTLERF
ncbi:MAG: PaRep2b protein, partial [Pyrobaculum sp.]